MCRNGVLLPQIAIIGPLIEAIGRWRLCDRGLDIVGAVEHATLVGLEIVRFSTGGYLPFAADDSDARRIAILVYVNTERAGFRDR